MKTCSICKQSQDLSEYNKNKTKPDGFQTVCRSCNRARSRKYYEDNHDKHRASIAKRNAAVRLESREYIWQYLDTHPCVDCGSTDKRVLDFDHVRGVKVKGVAQLAGQAYGLHYVVEEIKKCEVRCRNCHIIVTYERLGGSWHNTFLALDKLVDVV